MTQDSPVALLTGAARRIGAQTARTLHSAGFNIVIHYRSSSKDANQLVAELNQIRPDSAIAAQADLNQLEDIDRLAEQTLKPWGRLDALVNNASSFYPTPVGDANESQWDDLLNSNLKAPFFLAQALAEPLRKSHGVIINMADVHAERPLKNHPIYCAAKAGNVMLTKSLARELAPEIRVNGIAPGAILWPEQEASLDDEGKQKILDRVPLGRPGGPEDIAETILFLIKKAPYITGQIIAVDGGRSVS